MQFTHEACVTVQASARSVYHHWTEASELPRHLSHIRAVAAGDAEDLARLVIVLEGRHLEFAAQRTMCDDDTICWQSLGEVFLYVLTVSIKPTSDGTIVTVTTAYDPPGFLPDLLETMGLGKVFQRVLDADLNRYAHSLAQPEMSVLATAG